MSYIEESLAEGESIYSIFKLHWSSYVPVIFWIVMAIAAFFFRYGGLSFNIIFLLSGACLLISLIEYLKLCSQEQGVTTRRVVLKNGIIARMTDEMKLSSVETVEIRQTIMGRIFDYGDVCMTGRGVSDLVFKKIDSPLHVKKQIENSMEKQISD